MDNSVITSNKFIKSNNNEIKTISTNFNEKNITSKTQSFYILLTFLLMTITLLIATITLLIAVNIYCHLIKYQGKQKYFPANIHLDEDVLKTA